MTDERKMDSVQREIDALRIGDQVRIRPDRSKVWWRVAARNAQYVVLVRQAPFEQAGVMEYTVTGTLNASYNGEGPGPVCSSLNTLGGAWDVGENGKNAHTIIAALESGKNALSMRRVLGIQAVTVRDAPSQR